MAKVFLENKEGKWYVKWSDLQSFGYGRYWECTPIHPDTNVDNLKHEKEVNFEFTDMDECTFWYKYAKLCE